MKSSHLFKRGKLMLLGVITFLIGIVLKINHFQFSQELTFMGVITSLIGGVLFLIPLFKK